MRAVDILAEADAARSKRADDMPTEQDAIDAMYRAYNRLKDLGWREAIYMPKDGTVVRVIEIWSTGTFDCHYSGEWADGFFNVTDGRDVYPSRSAPAMFKLK